VLLEIRTITISEVPIVLTANLPIIDRICQDSGNSQLTEDQKVCYEFIDLDGLFRSDGNI
jgi:hypothetical protein